MIHVDLNSAAPLTVIEGRVEEGRSCTVFITKTTDFFNPQLPVGVQGATVVLSDDAGHSESLSPFASGIYQSVGMVGVSGRTYTLTVVTEGKQFTASSKLTEPVQLDSVYFLPQNPLNLARGYIAYSRFTDPSVTGNYYYFTLSNDTTRIDARRYITFSDRLNNGEAITFRTGGHRFQPGETVIVRMYSIDKGVYDYLNTLERTVSTGGGGAQQASPGNPVSNFTSGALGYFGAYSYTERTAVVP